MKVKIKGKLMMYEISEEYKKYLRKFDKKVSMKENRKFYGIIINANGMDYYIPFTSKIKKSTNRKLTVDIMHNKSVIAKLLLNNMIPVNMKETIVVDVNNSKQKEYYQNELRYLRSSKVKNEILTKIENIFYVLENNKHRDYEFFREICCNYSLLEEKCKKYVKESD